MGGGGITSGVLFLRLTAASHILFKLSLEFFFLCFFPSVFFIAILSSSIRAVTVQYVLKLDNLVINAPVVELLNIHSIRIIPAQSRTKP